MASRGGRGGGRGGAKPSKTKERENMLRGMGFEVDPNVKLETAPSPLFPPYDPYIPARPSEREKRQIFFLRELREQIHMGPLYTRSKTNEPIISTRVFHEDSSERYAVKSAAEVDPFTAVPTWGDKYERKQRAMPELSGRPFIKEFFPPELWPTIEGEENGPGKKKRKGLILAQHSQKKRKLEELLAEIPEDEAAADAAAEDDDELAPEEEEDDAYEEDEDNMGDDYDAENYFDDGERDDDDVGGGGGDYD